MGKEIKNYGKSVKSRLLNLIIRHDLQPLLERYWKEF